MSVSGMSLSDLITYLRNAMPGVSPGGVSDQALQSYLQANTQTNVAATNAAAQLAQQEQTNQLRQMELMGATPEGYQTDAASRWREELAAQQAVQNQRLNQELMALTGQAYVPQPLSYDEQVRLNQLQSDIQQRMGLLSKVAPDTADADRWRSEIAQFQAQVDQLNNKAAGVGGPTTSTLAATTQQQQNAIQQAQLALQQAQLGGYVNGHETLANMELMGYGPNGTPTLAARNFQDQLAQQRYLQQQQEQWQSGESAQERQLRLALQAGQLNQQESEFARSYILQQQESRRQQAQLAGYLDNGQLTEAARAARANELTQRGQLAAQLLGDPKDAFRAAAFFQTINPRDPTGMGLMGNQGVAGFNTTATRTAQMPQTMGMGDLDALLGAPQPAAAAAPMMAAAPAAAPSPAAAPVAAPATTTGLTGTLADTVAHRDALVNPQPKPATVPGAQPGGPTDDYAYTGGMPADPYTAVLAQLGMGAGGAFEGRKPPEPTVVVPQIPQEALEHPAVRSMFRELKDSYARDAEDGTPTGGSKGSRGQLMQGGGTRRLPEGQNDPAFDGALEGERRALKALINAHNDQGNDDQGEDGSMSRGGGRGNRGGGGQGGGGWHALVGLSPEEQQARLAAMPGRRVGWYRHLGLTPPAWLGDDEDGQDGQGDGSGTPAPTPTPDPTSTPTPTPTPAPLPMPDPIGDPGPTPTPDPTPMPDPGSGGGGGGGSTDPTQDSTYREQLEQLQALMGAQQQAAATEAAAQPQADPSMAVAASLAAPTTPALTPEQIQALIDEQNNNDALQQQHQSGDSGNGNNAGPGGPMDMTPPSGEPPASGWGSTLAAGHPDSVAAMASGLGLTPTAASQGRGAGLPPGLANRTALPPGLQGPQAAPAPTPPAPITATQPFEQAMAAMRQRLAANPDLQNNTEVRALLARMPVTQGTQGNPADALAALFGMARPRPRQARRGARRPASGGVPGAQPGGPVDAPMWPTDGSGSSSMPTLQTMSATSAPSTATAPSSSVSSLSTPTTFDQTDSRLAAARELLRRGLSGEDPQLLQKMGNAQKGLTEGAFDALGIDWKDFENAVQQTRFANNGSALSA